MGCFGASFRRNSIYGAVWVLPGVTPGFELGPGVRPALLLLPPVRFASLTGSEGCDSSVSAATELGRIIIITGFPSEFVACTRKDEGTMVMLVNPSLARSVRNFWAMCMFAPPVEILGKRSVKSAPRRHALVEALLAIPMRRGPTAPGRDRQGRVHLSGDRYDHNLRILAAAAHGHPVAG